MWKSCWWRRNQTRGVESADWRRNFLVNASVSSCVEVWQSSQRLANRCDYSDIQETRSQAMYKLQRDIASQFFSESICQMPWKEMPKDSGIKTGGWSVRFSSGSQHHRSTFTLKQIFKKSWEYGKGLFACFVDLEKAYDLVPRNKLWKVLRDNGVDGQLLCAIKSFYCRPQVCVRVNGKQSKPFHVGVGLWQGCFF